MGKQAVVYRQRLADWKVAAGLLRLSKLKSRNLSAYWKGEGGTAAKQLHQQSSHQNTLYMGEEEERLVF